MALQTIKVPGQWASRACPGCRGLGQLHTKQFHGLYSRSMCNVCHGRGAVHEWVDEHEIEVHSNRGNVVEVESFIR